MFNAMSQYTFTLYVPLLRHIFRSNNEQMSTPHISKDESQELLDRFLRYVQVDTEADPESQTIPSSLKQIDLSRILEEECRKMGLEEVELSKEGYVYASLPSNSDKPVPTICFCSHVDTAPDCSGKDVKPLVHRSYQGQDIVLPDDKSQVINPDGHPVLKEHLGEDIITASGKTLLGADDKSGIAIIMQTLAYLKAHPEIKRGKIRALFTTDEEIGKGVDHVDMDKLGADYGYTLDGGRKGSFEDETFSADALTLTIKGVSAHPGYAKGKMEHAIKIASEIVAALPKDTLSPESTSGREGFVHPVQITGELETAKVLFIIRDFDTDKLPEHSNVIRQIAEQVMKNYPGSRFDIEVKEQYRNMKEILQDHPRVSAFAEDAIRRAGMEVIKQPIRGGTDGSRLSFMGLPCANIFTGMHGIHSKQEWISLQDMERSMQTLVHLVQIWEERS
jgi:tripeptide aminopeptidase